MSFGSYSLRHPAFLVDEQLSVAGNDVRIAGSQTTDATPTTRVEPGTVVVKESGDGLYYLADAADGVSAGDINTVALVSSAEAPDGDWASKVVTWSVFYADGSSYTGTVTAAAGDDTVAEFVTLLNADAAFANHLVAAANTVLEIRSRAKGRVTVRISVNLTTAYGTVSGSSSYTEASGTEADYRVVTRHVDLVDAQGTALTASQPVATLLAGKFRESALSNLSNEAKAVLMGRGSLFE